MKAILICPADRAGVVALAKPAPLSQLLVLGKTLIEYWLEHLATRGAREVLVLAADRPGQVSSFVGNGSRWGLEASVVPETREPTGPEAIAGYRRGDGWMPPGELVNTMNHLPGFSAYPLLDSYAGFVFAHHALMPRMAGPDRIGLRQVEPRVWVGLRAHVAKSAQLLAPCWIGDHACIGHGAVIGPWAVIEVRSTVEAGAIVTSSIVGPDTLVGEYVALRHSIAWGTTLINWRLNSCIQVSDPFLICSLADEPAANAAAQLQGPLVARAHSLLDFLFLPHAHARKEALTCKFSQKTGC